MRLTALAAAALMTITPAWAQIDRVDIDKSAFSLGTLRPEDGALPRSLWTDTERNSVSDLLVTVPAAYDNPLNLELLRRVLLSPGEGPKDADNALAGQKLLKAAEAGFYSDAAQLANLAPSTHSEPALARVIAYQELMDGKTDVACARGEGLRDGRAAPFWIKLRFVCYVRAGEGAAADLTLNLLKRQDALTAEESARFTAFADGGEFAAPKGDITLFDWVMMHERGITIDRALLDRVGPGYTAAIARMRGLDPNLREVALLRSLSVRTIGADEAIDLLDGMGTTELAGDVLTLSAVPPGSLEYAEALGTALRRGGADAAGFEARARLLAGDLRRATPITNFAPNATEIALAAMITDQPRVAEAWITALASDQSRPTGLDRARRLVDIYAIIDPEAAGRIGSFIGMVEEPKSVPSVTAYNTNPSVPVASLVAAALPAAEAGSEGPAALVYLTGLSTTEDGEGGIRNAVINWARDKADIRWMDHKASFDVELRAVLDEPAPQVAAAPQPTGN
ncbi:hypothetical protein [Parvularcula marina]|uniref:Uncharacterized protein n=1 Tax=Parvularcula marina TaxID=2292771 RepID=A0A371RFZ1_9PROT|nr:hypothetical protein [Parvularcula marina]RFB04384.1 hypothetical protein DX908_03245 [Parvularcula marina]